MASQGTDDSGRIYAQGLNVAGSGYTQIKVSAANGMYTSGDIASGAADAGNPAKVGGVASASEPVAVDELDRVNFMADLAGNQKVVGNVAHDVADTGNPVKVGAKATAAKASNVTEGDRANLSTDLAGQLRVIAPDYSAALDAAAPSSALMVAGKGNAAKPAADDEGDIMALSCDLSGQLRTISPDVTAVLDAAIPASALLLGAKGNAAAPTADDEGDIIALSTDLQGSLRTIGNAAHDAVDAGEPVKIGGYGKAAAPAAASADGDRVNAWFDRYGRASVWCDLTYGIAASAIPAGVTMAGLSDGTNARAFKGDSSGILFVQGQVAHDAADAGNPLKMGAKANAALPAAVAENDLANLSADLYGQLRVLKQGLAVNLRTAAEQTAGTVNGDAVTGVDPFTHLDVMLDVQAAATEVDDTLDVYVDASADAGSTWVNIIHFTQVLGNGGAKKFVASVHLAANLTDVDVTTDLAAHAAPRSFLGNAIRYRSVVADAGGGAAAFTHAIKAVLKQA